MTVCWV